MTSVLSLQDEDTKYFYEATRKSRTDLVIWEKISALNKDNDSSLAEEMETTTAEVANFVADLETDLKKKKFRRESLGSDDYDSCKAITADIEGKLQTGIQVMDRVLQLIGTSIAKEAEDKTKVEVHSMHIPSGLIIEREDTSHGSERERAKETVRGLSAGLKQLLTRFARILDEEGVPHNYPVPKLPKKPLYAPAYELREPKEFVATRSKKKPPIEKKMRSTSSQSKASRTKSKIELTNVKSPLQFLEEYASQAKLNVQLIQVKTTRTAWYLEYIFSCKMHSLVGEGRGKSREAAKQDAASQIITMLIGKQKRKALPPELPTLTKREMDLGNSLLCEAINYEDELIDICSKENHRPPIFTTVGTAPEHVIRCNALLTSSIGRGKTKAMAKRMAAKNVIESVADFKRKTKEALKSSRIENPNISG